MKTTLFYHPFPSIRYVPTQTYIPLQSFNLESPLLTTIGGSKKPPADVLLKKYTKPTLNANGTAVAIRTDENFPVLKIEEDLDGITMTGCKTTSTSTQTSPIQEVANKKGSTSTIWTSEESILRSADTVDEDNKSTSSSACEETGVAMSSDKSGEFFYSVLSITFSSQLVVSMSFHTKWSSRNKNEKRIEKNSVRKSIFDLSSKVE